MIAMFGMTGYSLFYSNKDTDTNANKLTVASTYSFEQSSEQANKPKDLPDADPDLWDLVLVGPKNEISQEMDETELATLSDNSHQVDSRIAADYEAFSTAATEAGYPLAIISAYRSVAAQQEVFSTNVNALMSSEGLSEADAIAKTKETITEPGYSEHHTGLAVDIVDQEWYNTYPNQVLDASYGDQPGAQWIAENAPEYGFIIRYPKNEEDITGITYEPWHIRYVGRENAEYITKNNLTLEEYLKLLSSN